MFVCVCVWVQVEGEIREYNWVISMLTVKSWREILNVFEAVPTFEHNFLCLIEDLRPLLYSLWIFPLRLRALTLVMFTARVLKMCEKAFVGVKLESVFTVAALHSVSVSSLFPECGWHRNPSKAFYQAFQSGSRLRDSKAHIDRYSTGLVRAGLQECNIVCAVFSSSELCFFHVHGLSLETKPGCKRRISQ